MGSGIKESEIFGLRIKRIRKFSAADTREYQAPGFFLLLYKPQIFANCSCGLGHASWYSLSYFLYTQRRKFDIIT